MLNTLNQKPTKMTAFWLCLFTVIISFQPNFLHGEINLFETGIYFPGIDAMLNGFVPYKDFFYLRGPLELFIPTWMMSIFGIKVSILSLYFYIGTVAALLVCVLIGKEIFHTRLFFILFVPILIARTFPRVVYVYWGGFRFVWGLLAVYGCIRFLKKRTLKWMLLSGVFTAAAVWTSLDVGLCACISTGLLLLVLSLTKKITFNEILGFIAGFMSVSVLITAYLLINNAWLPFLESSWTVATRMQLTFPQIAPIPENLGDLLKGMFNPGSRYFKFLTPIYCFLFFMIYMAMVIKEKKEWNHFLPVMMVTVYAFVMYVLSFRLIQGSQFEMALQPEKIILFFLLERFYFIGKDVLQHDRWKKFVFGFLITGIIMSSVFFPIIRFQRRFPAFQWVTSMFQFKSVKSLETEKNRSLDIDRMKGMLVPERQAQNLNQLNEFISKNTDKDEKIFIYPEMGFLYFMLNRPFVGRFPSPTFAWMHDQWHHELMNDLRFIKPEYVIDYIKLPDYFPKTSLLTESNRLKHTEVKQFIRDYYKIVKSTPDFNIYQRIQSLE